MLLLNMRVIVDVVLAVAVVTTAPRAVSEFQFWVTNICATANGASMAVVWLVFGCCLRTKRNWAISWCFLLRFFHAHPTAEGEEIQDVFSHKDEIAAKCDQREQVMGEIGYRNGEVDHID